jgi:hypothetical protein
MLALMLNWVLRARLWKRAVASLSTERAATI